MNNALEISPDSPVRKAAQRALKDRLGEVHRLLAAATEDPHEDIEYVHRLRVATRRALAAISLFEELLPRRRARWMRKQLKRIRRAAGRARDLDVLAQRKAREARTERDREFVATLQKQRRRAQPPIVKMRRRLMRRQRLKRHMGGLIDRVGRQRRRRLAKMRFGDWARRTLTPLTRQFFDASTRDTSDLAALHRFRIQGKQLRYAMELLASAYPAPFRERLYPSIEQLQDLLGSVNDHAVAARRMQSWLAEAKGKKRRRHLAALLEREQTALQEQCETFAQWWDEPREREMRSQFQQYVSDGSDETTPAPDASDLPGDNGDAGAAAGIVARLSES